MLCIDTIIKWLGRESISLFRKGDIDGEKVSWIVHPISVFMACRRFGISNLDVLKAALCHDVLEDLDYTSDVLKTLIGERATGFVQELTWDKKVEPDKRDYIQRVACGSKEALFIKCVDRLENVRDFEISDPDYALQYLNKGKVLFLSLNTRKYQDNDIITSNMTTDLWYEYKQLENRLI